MKTDIYKIKGDWQDVVDGCRATVAKPPLGKDPSDEFKTNILIAEHEPIREIWIKWRWKSIKYWIAMHWKTHIWPSRTNTQRTDRTGIDRNELRQDEAVTFEGTANCQHLIDTWRKRLCGQASIETREYAEDFKTTLRPKQKHISDVLVPNCIYRCGCPETKMCRAMIWVKFRQWCAAKDIDVTPTSIRRRYELYNEWFYDVWTKEKKS